MAGLTPVLLVEVLLIGGLAAGFALWQIWDVRRSLRKDREAEAAKEREGG